MIGSEFRCFGRGSCTRIPLTSFFSFSLRTSVSSSSCLAAAATCSSTKGSAASTRNRCNWPWTPSTVWRGQAANQEAILKLETTVGNSGLFATDGDIAYTADGLVTLEASA